VCAGPRKGEGLSPPAEGQRVFRSGAAGMQSRTPDGEGGALFTKYVRAPEIPASCRSFKGGLLGNGGPNSIAKCKRSEAESIFLTGGSRITSGRLMQNRQNTTFDVTREVQVG